MPDNAVPSNLPINQVISQNRELILRVAHAHGARDVWVFGSYSQGTETRGSDIDILVTLEPQRSILDLIAIKQDLEDALGIEVDVVTADSLSPYIREQVLKETMPLRKVTGSTCCIFSTRLRKSRNMSPSGVSGS